MTSDAALRHGPPPRPITTYRVAVIARTPRLYGQSSVYMVALSYWQAPFQARLWRRAGRVAPAVVKAAADDSRFTKVKFMKCCIGPRVRPEPTQTDFLQQQLDGLARHRRDRLTHGGQCRPDRRGQRRVVEADDGQILRARRGAVDAPPRSPPPPCRRYSRKSRSDDRCGEAASSAATSPER